MGKQWQQWESLFSRTPRSLQMLTVAMKLKDTCSLEEKLWQTWHIKKQRHYFANKGLSSQSYGFSSSHVWMWELDDKESWAVKNWCFGTAVLEKTLESPLGWKGSNQSILKEISPEYSLEGLMLKLKLQYFSHLMWRTDSLGKTLMLRKIEGGGEGADRGWDGWMASLTQWTWVWVNSGSWWWTGRPGVLQSMGSQRVDTIEWLRMHTQVKRSYYNLWGRFLYASITRNILHLKCYKGGFPHTDSNSYCSCFESNVSLYRLLLISLLQG